MTILFLELGRSLWLRARTSLRSGILVFALFCNVVQVIGHDGLQSISMDHGPAQLGQGFALPGGHHIQVTGGACHSDESKASKQHALSEASLHDPALLGFSGCWPLEMPMGFVAGGTHQKLPRISPEAPDRPPKV